MRFVGKCFVVLQLILLLGTSDGVLHSQSTAIDTLFHFKVDTLYGYETASHVMVIPPKYSLAFPFRYGVAPVILTGGGYRNQVSALINLKGEYVIPPQPGRFNSFSHDSVSIVFEGVNGSVRYRLDGTPVDTCTKCYMNTIPGTAGYIVHHSLVSKLDSIEVRDSLGHLLYSVVGFHSEWISDHPQSGKEKLRVTPYWYVETNVQPSSRGVNRTSFGNIMNLEGKVLVDSAYPIRFYDGLGVLRRKDQFALVDLQLHERIPFSAGYTAMFYWTGSSCVSVKKDSLFGVLDTMGNVIMPCIYSNPLHPEGKGFVFRLNVPYTPSKKGADYYITRTGDTLINDEYWLESDNGRGQLDFRGPITIKNKKTDKYGIISYDKSVMIPCKYDCLGSLSEGRIVFFRGDTAGYLNARGEEVIELWFPCYGLSAFSEGRALASILLPGGRDQYPTAQIISDGQTTMARRFVWIDSTGQIINRQSFDWVTRFRDGVSLVTNNGVRYMVDTNLVRMTVSDKYDYCSYFFQGYAAITDGKKFGLVDSTGKIVIPVEYDEIAIREDGPGGISFIDNTGHGSNTYGQFIVPDIIDGNIKVRKGKDELLIRVWQ